MHKHDNVSYSVASSIIKVESGEEIVALTPRTIGAPNLIDSNFHLIIIRINRIHTDRSSQWWDST